MCLLKTSSTPTSSTSTITKSRRYVCAQPRRNSNSTSIAKEEVTPMTLIPGPQGLYNPEFEKDSCGVAFIADMHGRATRDIVDKDISALVHAEHRGAAGAEATTGDGPGMLMQIPHAFWQPVAAEESTTLPGAQAYATGIAFLPRGRMAMLDATREIEAIAHE